VEKHIIVVDCYKKQKL